MTPIPCDEQGFLSRQMLVGVRNRKLGSRGTNNRTVEWIYELKVKDSSCR